MELTLRDGPLAEEAHGHAGTPGEFVRQRQPDGERQAAGDDRVAAVKPGGGVEQVHGAAASAAAALDVAVHFGEDRAGGHTPQQCVTVLPVGGDDGVLRVSVSTTPAATASSPM